MANTLAVIQPQPVDNRLPGIQAKMRGDAQKTGTENFFKETAAQTFGVGYVIRPLGGIFWGALDHLAGCQLGA